MQLARLVISIFAVTLVACGGGSSTHPPDAKKSVDAAIDAVPPDAPNAAAMGLGKECDQTNKCPTTGATMCVALSSTATHGFCTLSCGTSTSNMTPPTNGNMTCANSTPKSPDGTPLCALVGQIANGMYPWSCALGCGTFNGMNLGQCPGGLVCMSNICQ